MKIQVTMKTPDALGNVIYGAVMALDTKGLDPDETEEMRDLRMVEARDLCDRWFRHGEYLTVEIDTEAETCVVVEKGQS